MENDLIPSITISRIISQIERIVASTVGVKNTMVGHLTVIGPILRNKRIGIKK